MKFKYNYDFITLKHYLIGNIQSFFHLFFLWCSKSLFLLIDCLRRQGFPSVQLLWLHSLKLWYREFSCLMSRFHQQVERLWHMLRLFYRFAMLDRLWPSCTKFLVDIQKWCSILVFYLRWIPHIFLFPKQVFFLSVTLQFFHLFYRGHICIQT